jgi:hypothetical protein
VFFYNYIIIIYMGNSNSIGSQISDAANKAGHEFSKTMSDSGKKITKFYDKIKGDVVSDYKKEKPTINKYYDEGEEDISGIWGKFDAGATSAWDKGQADLSGQFNQYSGDLSGWQGWDSSNNPFNPALQKYNAEFSADISGYGDLACNPHFSHKKSTVRSISGSFFDCLYIFIYRLILAIPFIVINLNTIYMLKYLPESVINLWFPKYCNRYPYGTDKVNPCMGGLDEQQTEELITKVALNDSGQDGGQGMSGIQMKQSEMTNINKIGHRLFLGNMKQPAFPYSLFNSEATTTSLLDAYISWLITAVAQTNSNTNSHIQEVYNSGILRVIPNGILVFTASYIILALIFVAAIYQGIVLTYNEFAGWLRADSELGLLIIILSFFIFLFNVFSVGFESAYILFKIMFYPVFLSKSSDLKKVIIATRIPVTYFVGLIFLVSLWQTPISNDWSVIIKLVPTLLYLTLMVIQIVVHLYNMIKH